MKMGLLQHKKQKLYINYKLASLENFEIANYGRKSTPKRMIDEVKPLEMKVLRSIFVIYFAGITISTLVLLIEIYLYRFAFQNVDELIRQ